MAFLCPAVFATNRKKRDQPKPSHLDEKYLLPTHEQVLVPSPSTHLGRNFSSTLSLDDELDVNAFLLVKQRYLAEHPSELSVKRNDIVMFLHKDRGWLFVRQKDGYEGYVPKSACKIYDPTEKKLPADDTWVAEVYHDRTAAAAAEDNVEDGIVIYSEVCGDPRRTSDTRRLIASDTTSDFDDIIPYDESPHHKSEHCCNCSGCEGNCCHCNGMPASKNRDQYPTNNNNVTKCACNRHRVASRSDYSSDDNHSNYSNTTSVVMAMRDCYLGNDDDVRVHRGEKLQIVFEEDDQWLWVKTSKGEEGYIPVAAVSADEMSSNNKDRGRSQRKLTSESSDTAAASSSSGSTHSIDLCGMTKLTVVNDYKALKFDEITLRKSEMVYANLKDQVMTDFTWVYSAKSRTFGFVPSNLLHVPKKTSL